MTTRRLRDLENDLRALYQEGRLSLPAYAWEWEGDRWREMVKALLAASGLRPAQVMATINALSPLGLLSATELAKSDAKSRDFIRRAMARVGVRPQTAEHATAVLVGFARTVQAKWGGHLQRFLRIHASQMVTELSASLADSGLGGFQSEAAATMWLQNTTNAPVLSGRSRHVRDFLEKAGVSESELLETADEMGINATLLDDLLAVRSLRSRTPRNPGGRGKTTPSGPPAETRPSAGSVERQDSLAAG